MSSRRRSQFRPCIDLRNGKVTQIVGGTLDPNDTTDSTLQTNFVAELPSSHFAKLYREQDLVGGHIIKLGPGNDEAALEALAAWKAGMQIGGGVDETNAAEWLRKGASKVGLYSRVRFRASIGTRRKTHTTQVILTSYLFPEAKFSLERLSSLSTMIGKENLVVDISCRRKGDGWIVAMNKWKTLTDMQVNQGPSGGVFLRYIDAHMWYPAESIALIERYCSELLVHSADVEGLCQGVDQELVQRLGEWVSIPCTYAGGARGELGSHILPSASTDDAKPDVSDLELIDRLSNGKVDLTFGSSLDIFGGSGVRFDELVSLNNTLKSAST
ncbi:hypothetical protein P7C73_g162, partial [Tremellales sp. Uapishka_1]